MGELLQVLTDSVGGPPCNDDHSGLGRLIGASSCEAGPIPCSSVTDSSAIAVELGVPVDGCGLRSSTDDVAADGLDVVVVADVVTSTQPADPANVVGALVGVERSDAEALEAMGPLAAMAVSAALGI